MQDFYFAITQQGSIKYLTFSGQEYCELGAYVNCHNHFKSHAPPFHATRNIGSAAEVCSASHTKNSGHTVKKYARRYLSYLPTSYVLAKRVEYIKDTFGQARHWKLARRAGCTLCTPCSLVSCSHARCTHRNHFFQTCNSFTSFSDLILHNHDK